jgi:uncharacterized protein (TIGR02147 family)
VFSPWRLPNATLSGKFIYSVRGVVVLPVFSMKETKAPPAKVNYRVWLQNELSRRCRLNSSYSLRAFARQLKLDPSTVSQLLSGRRNASAKLLVKICDRLDVSPLERKGLLADAKRKQKRAFRADVDSVGDYKQLSLDSFALMADWYHYAILELTAVTGFQNCPRWIARSLGISVTEAKIAIDRLKRLELLDEVDGQLRRTEAFVTNNTGAAVGSALKKLQRDWITKALAATENIDASEKDITSITMAIDVSKLIEARKLIAKFRREMCAFLEEGETSRVYTMGIQLFPVSKDVRTLDEAAVSLGENHEI